MRLHFPELRPNSKRRCCECDELAAIIADANQVPADKSRAYQQKRLHNERVQLERTYMIELEVQAQTQPVRRSRTHMCLFLPLYIETITTDRLDLLAYSSGWRHFLSVLSLSMYVCVVQDVLFQMCDTMRRRIWPFGACFGLELSVAGVVRYWNQEPKRSARYYLHPSHTESSNTILSTVQKIDHPLFVAQLSVAMLLE